MTAISVEHLTKRYGDVRAVDGISFELAPGTITGFVGVNGAGKSTTLRMLLGLTRPSSGRARIDGTTYAEIPAPARKVGALVDPAVFHPRRTGRSALGVLARASAIPDSRVSEVLDLVDLGEAAGRRVGGYSMGMRQRLGLAAALLGDPPTLILDEPANGLDPLGIVWLRTFLRRLSEEGRTVFVSSHQLAELAQTVDDVVLVHRGRLVAHAPFRTLAGDSATTSLEDLFLELISQGEPS